MMIGLLQVILVERGLPVDELALHDEFDGWNCIKFSWIDEGKAKRKRVYIGPRMTCWMVAV